MNKVNKNNFGFTLIEVLIYLGLFGILFGGAVAAAFNVVETSGRNQTKAMLQEEGNFLTEKINWTLSGAQSVSAPALGTACASPGCPLSVVKWNAPTINPVVIDIAGGDMTLSKGGNPPLILNNSNISISNLSFTHNQDSGDGVNPESLQFSFIATARTSAGLSYSQTFFSTNYLRK